MVDLRRTSCDDETMRETMNVYIITTDVWIFNLWPSWTRQAAKAMLNGLTLDYNFKENIAPACGND